ncbi:MAG: sugar phosphate nucleotidyltransferase [Desulfobulbaceae bacterium]|nr:sugar phosphate nucleotidyltransferase [Desulfobulbaceae bacterium]
MQAMLLAAGLGTRVQPYSKLLPKPLFPIIDKPLLRILIEMLKLARFTKIVVNVYHLGEQIEEELAGVEGVIVVREDKVLGTGGGLRNALPYFDDEPILVMNGDILHTMNPAEIYIHHVNAKHQVTLVLHDYPRFNKVTVRQDRILSFREKVHLAGTRSLAFTGIHVIEPAVLEKIPTNTFHNIIDLYEDMTVYGALGAMVMKNRYWRDIGTPEDYLQVHRELLTGKIIGNRWGLEHGPLYVSRWARMEPGVSLHDWCSVGDGAVIGNGAVLKRCVVWPNTEVPKRLDAENEIIVPNVNSN